MTVNVLNCYVEPLYMYVYQGHSAGCNFFPWNFSHWVNPLLTQFVEVWPKLENMVLCMIIFTYGGLCISCFKIYFGVSKTLQFVGFTLHLIILVTGHFITIYCVHIWPHFWTLRREIIKLWCAVEFLFWWTSRCSNTVCCLIDLLNQN